MISEKCIDKGTGGSRGGEGGRPPPLSPEGRVDLMRVGFGNWEGLRCGAEEG